MKKPHKVIYNGAKVMFQRLPDKHEKLFRQMTDSETKIANCFESTTIILLQTKKVSREG
jgi:hypothetical protein